MRDLNGTDISGLVRRNRKILGDDLPFATAKALTRTAQSVQRVMPQEINRAYDSPTRFTQKSTQIIPAKKRDRPIASEVFIPITGRGGQGRGAGAYLLPTIQGKARKHKGYERALIGAGAMKSSEYAVPADSLKLDRHGNISKANLRKIIEGVRKKGGEFFVPQHGLARGVYRRKARRRGTAFATLLILFVKDRPDYSKEFNFKGAAFKRARRAFPVEFEKTKRDIIRRKHG